MNNWKNELLDMADPGGDLQYHKTVPFMESVIREAERKAELDGFRVGTIAGLITFGVVYVLISLLFR